MIDLTQPVCVLLVSVLDFVPGDLTHAMSTLRARLSPGSLLVLSHGSDPEPRYAAQFEAVRQVYAQTDTPICSRTPEQIAALCTGIDLVAPRADADIAGPSGLVAVNQWRPDETTPAAATTTIRSARCAGSSPPSPANHIADHRRRRPTPSRKGRHISMIASTAPRRRQQRLVTDHTLFGSQGQQADLLGIAGSGDR